MQLNQDALDAARITYVNAKNTFDGRKSPFVAAIQACLSRANKLRPIKSAPYQQLQAAWSALGETVMEMKL